MVYARAAVLASESQDSGPIDCVAISPSGSYIATGDRAGTTMIWDVAAGKKLAKFEDDHSTEIVTLMWAPYSLRTLFIGRSGGKGDIIADVLSASPPVIINTRTPWPIVSMDVDVKTRSLALVVGPEVQLSRPIGLSGDYVPMKIFPRPRAPPSISEELAVRPRVVQVNRGATKLFATYLQHGIVCWDVAQETSLWQIFPGQVLHSTLFMRSRFVFLALENGLAELYRIGEYQPRLTVRYQENNPEFPPRTAALRKGRALAVGSVGRSVRIWDMQGDLLQEIYLDGPEDTQEPFSGLIASQDHGRTSYLACVMEKQSESEQRIIVFTAPYQHHLWAAIKDIMSESCLIAASTQSLLRKHFILLSVLLVLILAVFIMCQPIVWERMSPGVYDLSLIVGDTASRFTLTMSRVFATLKRSAIDTGISSKDWVFTSGMVVTHRFMKIVRAGMLKVGRRLTEMGGEK
ncbi:hypothetical protein PENSPDRAFT_693824 [Peniophora sp. CONT]|nr:hypothetical protein PENSPDRAFT_693824 [Peniophora sp. CONT]